MKVGDLVKFVGVANYYKDSVGIITKLYNTHGIKKNGQSYPNSAIVYMSDKSEGRSLQHNGVPYFHPLALDEIEVIQ